MAMNVVQARRLTEVMRTKLVAGHDGDRQPVVEELATA
jgi:hypothetical protein